MSAEPEISEADVAVVGMAGHFPGAVDVDRLWQRVRDGDDCLLDLSLDDLARHGVPASESASPAYVRRAGILDQVEYFDPAFFGIGPRDAAIMDPQHRHFIECSWEALEAAGIVPEKFDGAIGVFAGCGMDTYLINNLLPNRDLLRQLGWFLLRHTGNDKDFLSTTVSYRFDLRGPSVNVQTACSTSLVAVHLAVQSLLGMECDVALAGGATIEVPHGVGYEYQEGEILSPDGYCRAFDLASGGTVLTSGAGVVALRRLADAWEDGDPILAVIKGSAVNNDGARKVSYLAPSVDGHADVVKEALTVAGLSARDIQLLEAHGTGTPVGDPIEVAALTEAFRATTNDTGFCRLTSTKPNIGHLDTAAGVASLIKAVQALRHKTLPPIANFTGPSALLDIENTPFVLSGEAAPWPATAVRRAGISSLGVGGTNAHVVIEEAPSRDQRAPSAPEQVLALSGRDGQAVADAAERLAAHLEANPEVDLGDVAHTLATRRRHHRTRRVVTATDRESAIQQLRQIDRVRTFQHDCDDVAPRVAFLFPGGGSQYPGMATGFDGRFATFHDVLSDGIAKVRELSGVDIGSYLSGSAPAEGLNAPTVSLPSVFLTSLGLAHQWMEWGVQPSAYIGHSLGEYVAAHLAGVLTFDDAVNLVVTRAALMERVGGDGAAMLVVPLGEAAARDLLIDGVSLAVVNTDDECVIAGRSDQIARIEQKLAAQETPGTLIPLAAAAHSLLLDPVLDEFRSVVEATPLSKPTAPYMSNHTGTWITAEQATDPDYWVKHLRHTVRFADNLRTALSGTPIVTVELGPGQSLSSYARRCVHAPVAAIAALRHPRQQVDDTAYTLQAFAQQWATGVPVALEKLIGSQRQALTLPTYAFQRQPYWYDPPARSTEHFAVADGAQKSSHQIVHQPERQDIGLVRLEKPALMWWEPGWQHHAGTAAPAAGEWRRWWVVSTAEDPLAEQLCDELAARGCEIRRIEASSLAMSGDPGLSDHDAMLVVGGESTDVLDVDAASSYWLGTGLDAVRMLGAGATVGHRLALVTRGAFGIEQSAKRPVDAMALGVVQVAPHEYPDLDTIMIDVETTAAGDIASIVDDLISVRGDRIVAHRGERRLVPTLEHPDSIGVDMAPSFIDGGTYLLTGGLGAIGHTIAMHLARRLANLAIVTSSDLPPPSERDSWIRTHGPMEPTSQRLRRLAELESLGARVEVIVADFADPEDVTRALDQTERAFGRVDGAVHAAGTLCDRLIGLVQPQEIETVVGVKARGAVTLASELQRRGGSLLVLVSSTSTVLTPAGQVAYVASNAVLDSLSGHRDDLRVVTIGYGVWSEIGMAQRAARRERLGLGAGTAVVHPIFEELIIRDGDTSEVVGHLSSSDHWLVDEHRTTDGHAILPGTGHLELLISAVEITDSATLPVSLASVTIHEALAVPDDTNVAIRVCISKRGDRHFVELESDGGPAVGWRMHSSAELVSTPSRSMEPGGIGEGVVLTAIDPLAGQRESLLLGPRWKPAAMAMIDDDVAQARVELEPSVIADHESWRAHPALIDAATGLATQLVRKVLDSNDLLVPISYDSVTLFSVVPSAVQVVALQRPVSDARAPKVDLRVYDDEGRGVLNIDGLQLWPVAPGQPLGSTDDEQPVLGRINALAQLAEGLGIRPDEGVELLEQLLTSGRPRLVASSVDLNQLRVVDTLRAPVGPDEGTAVPAGPSQAATVLERIGAIWEDLLGVGNLGPDDNFFDLGGHSLIAIRLMARLQRELGVRLQLTDIFEAPSLGTLSKLVEASMPDMGVSTATSTVTGVTASADTTRVHKALVQISAGGDGAPLFIVHGAGGNILFLWSLARALSGGRSVYGFQALGVDSRDMPDPTIEAMASRYIGELRANHSGPYVLGGYSGGGLVAMEMARQLCELGEEVTQVVLFDSVPPGCTAPSRGARTRNLYANYRRYGWESVRPYFRRKAARWYRKVRPRHKDSLAQIAAEERVLGLDLEEVEGYVNLFHYFSATADRYQLARYPVDVTVLKADHVWPIQPHDYYWSKYVDGRLETRSVPGDHHSMFYPELAPRLAHVVKERLDEVEAKEASAAAR